MKSNLKMNLSAIALALSLGGAVAPAMAHDSYAGGAGNAGLQINGFQASGQGYANSATSGGSNATGSNQGTGYTVQFSSNNGVAGSYAGAVVVPGGVGTYSGGGSTSVNQSGGYQVGNGVGSTAGGVGSDYGSAVNANFQSVQYNLSGSAYVNYNTYGAW